ncbi:glycosyltransferase family 2 protein [Catenuloplanes indicus]|uniref:Dolichol-phosphate mannosyltransferase n=1 Tax=Catenuloplanes indicus TaxID=137267 RepID=A0AAE3VWA6_9ACTN|nr:glycosyltransferase family 2 protein [Catenuloplanes indicus]MDQ0364514.1 dolichol-phosphate mannosyltransferase [Catenuloplanes indicus]
MRSAPTLSVVVPIYNEEAVLPSFAERLRPVLDGLGESYEVVAVDDGSRDATPLMLTAMRRSWPQLRVIRLSRNCGHQGALTAGLHRAYGEYVASIDADLQDPPEALASMLRLAQAESLDIVYGVRTDRTTDTVFKRWTAGAYYRLMRRVVGRNVPSQAGDFRLLSRATVDVLRQLPENRPVYRLLVPWTGLPSGEITYVREKRAAGESKYPLSKMIRLALDSITGFTASPLRLATWLGLAGMLVCVLLAVFTIITYLNDSAVHGWASSILITVFLGAVQLLCLGLLGEYVARIYVSAQGRPNYFVGYDSAAETGIDDRPATPVIVPHQADPDRMAPTL